MVGEAAGAAPRPTAVADRKLRIFISYSRKDEEFAQELVTGLQVAGFEPFIDKRDIEAGEDWEARLSRLIDSADTVVYVISPNSIASRRCAWEVGRTVTLGKRLLPVVWKPVEEGLVPGDLKRLNYIYFNKEHSFAPALLALGMALRKDLNWVREHTRLLTRAQEWEAAGKASNRLLTGRDVADAKAWLEQPAADDLKPTELHRDFIQESERAEALRLSAEHKRAQILKLALACACLLAVAAAGLGLWALKSKREAVASQEAADKTLKYLIQSLPAGWPKDDADSPDYRHLSTTRLGRQLKDKTIELGAEAIELLITTNSFEPTTLDGKVIIALRGALYEGYQPPDLVTSIRIKDVRPDHRTFRSVFIVYDRTQKKIAAFKGSTVPNAAAIRRTFEPALYARIGLGGDGDADRFRNNLLPTGSYPYVVGPHIMRPGMLRQVYADGSPGVAVRRSFNDLAYGLDDEWDIGLVFDNLHPSWSSVESEFSSVGSLTIEGSLSTERTKFEGQYALFRSALGLGEPLEKDHGKRIDVLLLTGLDAAIATELLTIPAERPLHLERLRQGSKGEKVRRLQEALGVTVTGYLGPHTVVRLAELQQSKLGWSDGIYSPEMDELLGLCVLQERKC